MDGAIAAAPIKRRAVERRFTAALGYRVRKAVENAHVRLAEEILQTTELPVTDVAARSGFTSPSRLCEVFRKSRGMTPAESRQQGR